MAVGTVVVTVAGLAAGARRYTLAWTADAAGAVSANPFDVCPGRLLTCKVIPGTGGDAPDALYDLTLVDTNNIDLLDGRGANLSATVPKLMAFDPPLFQDGSQQLDVVVANAGNANTGTVVLIIGSGG